MNDTEYPRIAKNNTRTIDICLCYFLFIHYPIHRLDDFHLVLLTTMFSPYILLVVLSLSLILCHTISSFVVSIDFSLSLCSFFLSIYIYSVNHRLFSHYISTIHVNQRVRKYDFVLIHQMICVGLRGISIDLFQIV